MSHRPAFQKSSERFNSVNEFTTADVYTHDRELEQLHPDNRHVRDKIRQQLQVLRDAGLLLHIECGVWRLP
jgi:type II restriction enzyme